MAETRTLFRPKDTTDELRAVVIQVLPLDMARQIVQTLIETPGARADLIARFDRVIVDRWYAAGVLACHDASCTQAADRVVHGPHGAMPYCEVHGSKYAAIMAHMAAHTHTVLR